MGWLAEGGYSVGCDRIATTVKSMAAVTTKGCWSSYECDNPVQAHSAWQACMHKAPCTHAREALTCGVDGAQRQPHQNFTCIAQSACSPF